MLVEGRFEESSARTTKRVLFEVFINLSHMLGVEILRRAVIAPWS